MTVLILVGGPDAAAALPVLAAAGLEARPAGGAAGLREADRRGVRYTLVHVGADDGEPGGSYQRANHRVAEDGVAELAERLRSRGRKLVRCLAFGYRQGPPPEATWVVDVRFLGNPYWVPELRPLDGTHPAVAGFVLGQPAAIELLDRLEGLLRWALPRYQGDLLTVAFGCTGGRHRSVVMAREMARRLAAGGQLDAEVAVGDGESARTEQG